MQKGDEDDDNFEVSNDDCIDDENDDGSLTRDSVSVNDCLR